VGDEPTHSGWLPPRAPGGEPAPLFEPAPPEPEGGPAPPARAAVGRDRPNGVATASLVLGILGLVIVIPTLGAGFLFSLPFSIGAWVTGHQGRRRVATGESRYGDGTAHGGVVLGIVGVILGVIGAAVWIALYAAGYTVEDFRRDLEQEADQAVVILAHFGR
jgi:hypothetical protein